MTIVAIKGILATAFGHEITDDKAALDIDVNYNKVSRLTMLVLDLLNAVVG